MKGLKELDPLSMFKVKGLKARLFLSPPRKKKRRKSLFKYVEVGEQRLSKWINCKGLENDLKT